MSDLSWLPDPPRPAPAAASKADLSWLPDQPEEPSLLRTAVSTGLRVVPAVAGGAVGSLAGPIGTAAGGAGGAALGELLAEWYEGRKINPTQVAVQAGLGAIPIVGRAGAGSVVKTALYRGGQGALLGGAGSVATDLAEGDTPSLGRALTAAGLGTVLGGGMGAVESKVASRLATRQPAPVDVPPPSVHVPPPDAAPAGRLRVGQRADQFLQEVEGSPLKRAEVKAKLAGEDVPAQQPLAEARKKGDEELVKHFPEEQQDPVRRVIAENDYFEAQRRGVQPIERTNAIARHLAVSAERVLPKGTALNATELQAVANHVATINDRISTLSQKVLAGEESPVTLATLEVARRQQDVLMKNLMGARAEAGRALRQLQEIAQVLETRDERAIDAALKIPGIRENFDQFLAQWQQAGTDIDKMNLIRSYQTMTPGEKVVSYYLSNILSGAATTARNILGTTTNLAFKALSHPVAVGVDVVRSAATGAERSVFMSELPYQLAKGADGLAMGLKNAAFTLRNGFTPQQLAGFQVGRAELRSPLKYVGRFLDAQDQVFYTIAESQEKAGRIHVRALNEAKAAGLKGVEADRFVLQRKAELWTNTPREIAESAAKAAQHAVFREDPGKFVAGILDLKRNYPAIGLVLPFVKTPGALPRQGYEATAVSLIPGLRTHATKAAMAAGGRDATQAIARAISGTIGLGVGAPILLLAVKGDISGSGPVDPAERAALMEAGWRPNSIRLGDRWVSYQEFQPLNFPLQVIANGVDAYSRGDYDGAEKIFKTLASQASSQFQSSYLSGLGDMISAIYDDTGNKAEQFVTRLAQGFVPASGLARNVAQGIDPVVRKPQNMIERVEAALPGLSKGVQPRLSRFGEPVVREGGPLRRAVPVPGSSTVKQDPIAEKLSILGIKLNLPDDQMQIGKTRVKLSEEESFALRQAKGQEVRKGLERYVGNPAFERKSPEAQERILRDAITRARQRAAKPFRRRHRNDATE